LQRQVLSLGKVIDNMSRMLQRLIGEDIALEVEQAENVPPLEADAAMLEQIFLNLAVNSRDAMPRGGRLTISTDVVAGSDGLAPAQWVRLRVRDTGCGMPPEVQARIFEPFYTTKEVGKGTGLGLATVFGIVKQHGGLIEVESEAGRGTTFTILLPPTDKALETKTEFITKQALKRGAGETVLLVEDEPILRELAQAILVDGGYKVLEAEQSEGALAVWEKHQDEIDLLLTDMVLPGGMTGRELALKLQKLKPALKVVYSTGYSPDDMEAEGTPFNFLQKPYPPEMLMRTVRSSLDS
jgi:CheY-like chemotaxis protein/two-component sensor histidine kinase